MRNAFRPAVYPRSGPFRKISRRQNPACATDQNSGDGTMDPITNPAEPEHREIPTRRNPKLNLVSGDVLSVSIRLTLPLYAGLSVLSVASLPFSASEAIIKPFESCNFAGP